MDSDYYNNLSKELEKSYNNLEAFYLEKNTGKSNTIQAKLEEIRRKQEAIKLKEDEDFILSLNNPNEGLEKINLEKMVSDAKVEEEEAALREEEEAALREEEEAPLKDFTPREIDSMNKDELLEELTKFQLRSKERPNTDYNINTSGKGNIKIFKKALKHYVEYPNLTPEKRYTFWINTLKKDVEVREEKAETQIEKPKKKKRSSKKQIPIEGKGYFDSSKDTQNALMLLASYINGNDNPYLVKDLKKLLKKM